MHLKLTLRLVLLLAYSLSTGIQAVELPFLNYGPAFRVELQVSTELLHKQIREDLIEQRKSNTEMSIYNTTAKFARAEKNTLEKILRARGYYQANIDFVITDKVIVYRVKSGPQYTVHKITFTIPENINWVAGTGVSVGIEKGDALEAQRVLDSLQRFGKRITNNNCLLQVKTNYRVFLDNENYQAEIEFIVEPSEQVYINAITLSGLKAVDSAFLRRKIKIQEGACFKRNDLDKARLALLQSSLVASSEHVITHPKKGSVDLEFTLTERNHRSVKVGVGYSSDEKAILGLGWEHRNLLGAGQKFALDMRFSHVLQSVNGRLTFPELYRPEQTLEFYGGLSGETREHYETETITGGVVLTRELNDLLSVSGGTRLKLSSVRDLEDREEFAFLSFPLSATFNTTDDLLDPTEGWILTAQIIPYIDLFEPQTQFIKMIGSASGYYTVDDFSGAPTFAFKTALGSLTGADLKKVPADERYYSGGGGSVRGYPYQSLSQYEGEDPLGGRSFVEASFEVRFRYASNWGSVLFVDGGFAEPATTPSWTGSVRQSAGVGLRYFTAATPLRFDIAWPLQRRKDIDEGFQLYISLGQAF